MAVCLSWSGSTIGRRVGGKVGRRRCGMLTLGRLPSRLPWRSWQLCVMLRIASMCLQEAGLHGCQRDMQVAHTDALQQSTLARYLPMLGPDASYCSAQHNAALPGWRWAYS
jgi:hypothetical protein